MRRQLRAISLVLLLTGSAFDRCADQEIAMHQMSHPTKEQVRAYMQQRESARRPPPAPAEIRRQLGWSRTLQDEPLCLCGQLFLPSMIGQLAALLALQWLFRAATFNHLR